MSRDYTWISPGAHVTPSGFKALVRTLLDLADDPHDVYYPGHGTEVAVAPYLAARFEHAMREPDPPHPPPSAPAAAPAQPPTPAPPRRSPRRSRKDK